MSETFYFIIKETEGMLEILSGFPEYNEAAEAFKELTTKWKGRETKFRIISCPLVMEVKVLG